MSKAILMSIKPEYGEKILSGEKTIELRKNAPAEVGFIYDTDRTVYLYFSGTGVVMGKFRLEGVRIVEDGAEFAEAARLKLEDIEKYGPGRDGLYRGWRIKEPKRFETPIPLSEFYRKCDEGCPNCDFWKPVRVNAEEYDMDCSSGFCGHKPLTRPPESWCYVYLERLP